MLDIRIPETLPIPSFANRLGDVLPGGDGGYPIPLDTTLAALGAIGNAINTTSKTKHKLVSDELDRVWRALGTTASSKWRPLDDQSGASDITPEA